MKYRAFFFLALWLIFLLPVAASQNSGSAGQDQPKLVEVPKDGGYSEKDHQSSLIWIAAVLVAAVAIILFLVPSSSFRRKRS